MEKQTYYLNLYDLASSLFIILMENNNDIKEVTFSDLTKFSRVIEKEAEKNNFNIVFVLSRDKTIEFFNDHSDTFHKDNDRSIIINEGVTPYNLILDRSYIPLDVLLMFNSDSLIDETLNVMGLEKTIEPKKELGYYINELRDKIYNYATNMEFEKCIPLRSKYKELLGMERQLKPEVKRKKLTFEKENDLSEPRSIWDWPM